MHACSQAKVTTLACRQGTDDNIATIAATSALGSSEGDARITICVMLSSSAAAADVAQRAPCRRSKDTHSREADDQRDENDASGSTIACTFCKNDDDEESVATGAWAILLGDLRALAGDGVGGDGHSKSLAGFGMDLVSSACCHHLKRTISTVLLWERAVVYLSPEGSSAIKTVHFEGSKQESYTPPKRVTVAFMSSLNRTPRV